ncbi:hypothetical protein FOZ60_012706 [Perkinsus olseni]|uniref:Uncharacterized protein n=1 Tax=Perkinsus olseni TaxID=32597 RepID=A0A7J6S7B2_PEROL|nr:hypothetical protein FOZ60_012706 [Perkinsus olseni]KAF4728777.1 hypothetical protein FOZ62_003178 [Perkinsus olseni]
MLNLARFSLSMGLVSGAALQQGKLRAFSPVSEPPPPIATAKDPQGDAVDIRLVDDTCYFDYGEGNVTLSFSIQSDEYAAAADHYDGGYNFKMKESSQNSTYVFYITPQDFYPASGPTKEIEAKFKSVNPFHHLKEAALAYLKPTPDCVGLFNKVMSMPPKGYKKGAEGFLKFLRATDSERLKKIAEWNEKKAKKSEAKK